ncbi:MAG: hypothetical protein KF754_07305 [Planctomycetes bacterium]|nr:hypothetical protein [Planctomycetota bacterium]
MAEADLSGMERQCRRAVLAAGCALALVFVLALTGAASITLIFDTPGFQEKISGFEGFVLDTVRFLSPLVKLLHTFGGYVAFVLSGWAAIEMFVLARTLRRGTSPEVRQYGPRVLALGVAGGTVLAVMVGVLTVSGTAASMALRKAAPSVEERPEPLNPMARHIADPTAPEDSLVNEHTRSQTYAVGIAALLLAAAASQARKARKAVAEAIRSAE